MLAAVVCYCFQTTFDILDAWKALQKLPGGVMLGFERVKPKLRPYPSPNCFKIILLFGIAVALRCKMSISHNWDLYLVFKCIVTVDRELRIVIDHFGIILGSCWD